VARVARRRIGFGFGSRRNETAQVEGSLRGAPRGGARGSRLRRRCGSRGGSRAHGRGGEGEGDGHEIDVGISMDSYFDMIGEELRLPNLLPKENGDMVKEKIKWNRIAKVGNNSLLHKRKTLKNAFKRLISSSDYDPEDLSNFYPIKDDKEFRSWSSVEVPDTNAAIFFVSDISASMDEPKRALIRELCWYLENWIERFYQETQIKYIVHDHHAQEVDKEKFYKYQSGGGTKISSAFELVNDVIEKAFPLSEWNIYVFYLSDGENFGSDNDLCVEHLKTMQNYAIEKLEKMARKYDSIISVEVFFKKENDPKGNGKICEMEVSLSGPRIFASSNEKNFEVAVKNTISDLEKQLEKRKAIAKPYA